MYKFRRCADAAYPLDGGRIFADLLLMAGVAADLAAKIVAGVAMTIGTGIIIYGFATEHLLAALVRDLAPHPQYAPVVMPCKPCSRRPLGRIMRSPSRPCTTATKMVMRLPGVTACAIQVWGHHDVLLGRWELLC